LFESCDQFFSRYSLDEIRFASAFAMNQEFSPLIANQMDYFMNNPATEKIRRVEAQLNDTQQKMNENIEKLITRGEKVELLVGTSNAVAQKAEDFKSRSEELQWNMWKKKISNIWSF